MKNRFTSLALFAAIMMAPAALMTPAPAFAQDLERYLERQTDLKALASLFGELHHLRRTCEPRAEADIWRERMKRMIDLEEPQEVVREDLVAKFNAGYRGAQRRYPTCDRRSRNYAAGRAAEGDIVVRRLMASLEEAHETQIERSPLLIQPDGEQNEGFN